jgi:predicted RNA-binding Zn ribbon-like protein
MTPEGYLFERTGGDLALDFANTVDGRPTPRARELLADFGDLVSWGAQSGILGEGEARRLRAAARKDPGGAEKAVRNARALREAIFRIFSLAAAGRRPTPASLETLNDSLSGLGRLRLAPARDGCAWVFRGAAADFGRVVWPVSRAAAELLTSDALGRVRECAAPECAWLFLDGSKNGTRRWCDMTVCGNRAKARRHYEKTRRRRFRPDPPHRRRQGM